MRELISIVIMCVCALVVTGQGTRKLERENSANNTGSGRTALVIGNGSYADAPLKNPVNDAADMAATLKGLGFEVLSHTNLDQNGMKRAIREFGAKLRAKRGVGLFYYAGHGVQVRGVNYLVPVGANVNTEQEVEYESVEAGLVLAQMESASNEMNIVILDACRNNPFARSYRSADKGLAQLNAPSGSLIAYSTAPGSVAGDGAGRNGIYTQELLKQLRTPGRSIEEIFKQVRISVRGATREQQTPWESSSLTGEFYFSGTRDPSSPAAVTDPPVTRKLPSSDEVLTKFSRSVGSDRAALVNSITMKGTGEYLVRGQKFTSQIEMFSERPGKSALLQKFSNGNIATEVFPAGDIGWIFYSTTGAKDALPDQIALHKLDMAVFWGDFAAIKRHFSKISVTGTEFVEGNEMYVLEGTGEDGKLQKLYFDTTSGLLRRWDINLTSVALQQGISVPNQMYADDYVDVQGLQVALKLRRKSAGSEATISFDLTQLKYNVPIADSVFARPTAGNSTTSRRKGSDGDAPAQLSKKDERIIQKESMFTFELHKCVKSGSMVTCDFTITNNDKLDKKLGVPFPDTANGRTFDDQGGQSEMDSWQIGSNAKREAVLIPEVPVKAYVRFKGVSPQARILKRIDIGFEQHFSEGGDYKRRDVVIRFNDIVLQ